MVQAVLALGQEHVQEWGPDYIEQVHRPLIRIPTRSSNIEDIVNMHKASEFIVQKMQAVGLESRLIKNEHGHPLAYGQKIINPELPTVLIYAHSDTVDTALGDWNVEGIPIKPYDAVERNGRIYGPGASDMKGPLTSVLLALDFFHKNNNFPCNVKVLVENNEEYSAHSTMQFLDNLPRDLKLDADLVIIPDARKLPYEGDVPQLVRTMKGLVEIGVSSKHDIDKLVQTIHNMHDQETNRINIPGYYDDVPNYKFQSQYPVSFSGLGHTIPEIGFTNTEAIWARPALDLLYFDYAKPVHGGDKYKLKVTGPDIAVHQGAYGGSAQDAGLNIAHLLAELSKVADIEIEEIKYGNENLTPVLLTHGYTQFAVRKIKDRAGFEKLMNTYDIVTPVRIEQKRDPSAYIANRIVEGQDHSKIDKLFLSYLENQGLQTHLFDSSPPFITDTSSDLVNSVYLNLSDGWGQQTQWIGSGGSNPLASKLIQTASTHTLAAAIALPLSFDKDNWHTVNESYARKDLIDGAYSIICTLAAMQKN